MISNDQSAGGLNYSHPGGEEKEESHGDTDRVLAGRGHRGESHHQEIRREIPQEEGDHHGEPTISVKLSRISYVVWMNKIQFA